MDTFCANLLEMYTILVCYVRLIDDTLMVKNEYNMRKQIIIFIFTTGLLGCSPKIYNVYEKYENNPKFERTQLSGDLLQLASLFVPEKYSKEQNLIENIKSVDIVNYTGEDKAEFEYLVQKSLKRIGYREVIKNKETNDNLRFFAKSGIGQVTEFHVVNSKSTGISIFSIKGRFPISELKTVYNTLKKQGNLERYINGITDIYSGKQ